MCRALGTHTHTHKIASPARAERNAALNGGVPIIKNPVVMPLSIVVNAAAGVLVQLVRVVDRAALAAIMVIDKMVLLRAARTLHVRPARACATSPSGWISVLVTAHHNDK